MKKKNLQTPAAGISLDIIGKEKIPYIDLSFNPMFMGKSQWFVDKVHLNRTGAVVFSKLLPGLMKGKGEKFGKKKNTY